MSVPPALARAAILGFLSEAMVFPAGLITAAYLTRSLGIVRYGELALVYAVVSPVLWVVSTALTGRVGVALLTDAGDSTGIAPTLLRANALLGLGTLAVFTVAAPAIARAVGHPDLVFPLRAAAVEIAIVPVLRVHRDALVARHDYLWPATASFVFHLTRLTLVLVFVAMGATILSVIVANVSARLVELATCRSRAAVPLKGRVQGGLGRVRAAIGSVFVYTACLQLYSRIDLVMLGLLRAEADDLGRYGAAVNLAQAPYLLAGVAGPLLIAGLRRAIAMDAAAARALKRRSTRLATALWALAGPVVPGASGLSALVFGSAFAASGPMLGWLCVSSGGFLVISVLSAHEVAEGRYGRPLLAALPLLAIAIALLLAWIPRGGAMGAAQAMALAPIVPALIAMGFCGLEGLRRGANLLFRAAAAAAAGYLVTSLAVRAAIVTPLNIVCGGIASLAVMMAIGLVSVRDVREAGLAAWPRAWR